MILSNSWFELSRAAAEYRERIKLKGSQNLKIAIF
jgi:hypothetical protein